MGWWLLIKYKLMWKQDDGLIFLKMLIYQFIKKLIRRCINYEINYKVKL